MIDVCKLKGMRRVSEILEQPIMQEKIPVASAELCVYISHIANQMTRRVLCALTFQRVWSFNAEIIKA